MGNKIVILGTGGTIAGTAESASDVMGYTAAQLGIEQLVGSIPSLSHLSLVTEQVAQVDSKDMSHALWQQLARRVAQALEDPAVRAVVITHGTDTLEETAYFLHAVLQPAKPVVLTCAMRPATALMADGPQNIVDAMAVAQTPGAEGVLAVCAGVVHSAVDVQKLHTYRLDAFTSGDAGPLGFVEQGKLRRIREWLVPAPARGAGSASDTGTLLAIDASAWPRVEIVFNHAGATGRLVELLVKDKVQGLVVAGTGNGTLHQDLEAALRTAAAAGVRVVRSTRCALGRVYPSDSDAFPDSAGLTPVKARIAMMLAIARSETSQQ